MVTIRNKILAGYLILLILMVANGYLSIKKIAEITNHIDDLSNHLATRLIHSKNIDYHTALVRGYAGAYAWSQSTANQNAFQRHMKQLKETISALASTTTSPDERLGIQRIQSASTTYQHAFTQLVSLVNKRENLTYGIMNESKFNIESRLKAIKILVSHQNHLHSFYAFDNTQDAFMQMLRYTSEYARQGDERFSVFYEKVHQNVLTSLENLKKSFKEETSQANVLSAKASIDNYHHGFMEFRKAYRQQISLLREMFQSHEPVITDAVTQVVKGIEAQYETHYRNAQKILSDAKKRLFGFMTAAVIIGIAIGFFLAKRITEPMKKVMSTSRQIAGEDLKHLTRQLNALAQGDSRLQFNVTAKPLTIESSDETGETARAFNEIIYQLQAAERAFFSMADYLEKMTHASLAVAQGDYSIQVEKQSQHDMLGHALALMTKNLERAQEEISQHQTHLEKLVKQRTADLEENRRLLFTLMSNLPGMAYRCFNDTHWTMEFVSEGSLDLTGYPPDNLISNDEIAYADIIHPDDRVSVRENVQAGLSKGIPFVCIYRIITKQHETKWVWEKGRGIFSKENALIAIEGFISDITEQKELENQQKTLQSQLAQAQKMESVGRLAGGVAHDFNNMLSVILGNTEMMISDVAPHSPLIPHLEQIENATKRSSDLTRQLLAFARKQPIMPQLLDINETIHGMIKMLRRLIGEDIDLIWHPKEGVWSVKMDPSQIDQILANLCINARDAIKGVGKVIIESDNQSLDAAYCDAHAGFEPGDYVVITVSDTGHGMSSELQDNIFEPFFTTKKTGEGTGLGLATVYGIVKQNKGSIRVKSELEKGTTFKIYLPADRERAKLSPLYHQATTHHPLQKGKETILLVEDEEAILTMTT